MIALEQLQELAREADYDSWREYADDYDYARCATCRRWGKFGEEVYSNATDYYCDEHRPQGE